MFENNQTPDILEEVNIYWESTAYIREAEHDHFGPCEKCEAEFELLLESSGVKTADALVSTLKKQAKESPNTPQLLPVKTQKNYRLPENFRTPNKEEMKMILENCYGKNAKTKYVSFENMLLRNDFESVKAYRKEEFLQTFYSKTGKNPTLRQYFLKKENLGVDIFKFLWSKGGEESKSWKD